MQCSISLQINSFNVTLELESEIEEYLIVVALDSEKERSKFISICWHFFDLIKGALTFLDLALLKDESVVIPVSVHLY